MFSQCSLWRRCSGVTTGRMARCHRRMASRRRAAHLWSPDLLEERSLLSPIAYSVDLRTGIADSPLPPYLTVEVPPSDTNGDGWRETVLRINLNDPSISNPYYEADFRIEYDAAPTGMSVNIGDSRTNDGFGGDAGTQSNDAEINIGKSPSGGNVNDLYILGKD